MIKHLQLENQLMAAQRGEENYHDSFSGSFLSFLVTPLNPRTNFHKQTSSLKHKWTTHTGLTWCFMCRRKDLILAHRSACVPLSLRSPMAAFILFCITAVEMSPLPSKELSPDLHEHPCNYICLNRGQILALASGQGLLHFPAKENLRSMCVCAKYILQAWNNCEEAVELESLFTRQTFASTFQIRFWWSCWTAPDLWKWGRFPIWSVELQVFSSLFILIYRDPNYW